MSANIQKNPFISKNIYIEHALKEYRQFMTTPAVDREITNNQRTYNLNRPCSMWLTFLLKYFVIPNELIVNMQMISLSNDQIIDVLEMIDQYDLRPIRL